MAAKTDAPKPIPAATDKAVRLELDIAIRATRRKLAPGLIAPKRIATPIAETAIKSPVIHVSIFNQCQTVPHCAIRIPNELLLGTI
jgi:hypothetical protein